MHPLLCLNARPTFGPTRLIAPHLKRFSHITSPHRPPHIGDFSPHRPPHILATSSVFILDLAGFDRKKAYKIRVSQGFDCFFCVKKAEFWRGAKNAKMQFVFGGIFGRILAFLAWARILEQ
ncbi:hypothetical protein [Helicobacter sp. 11S02596-1]|uniref:hypothetical protein n=1 Tax=Helicobacter sp. 11S02596-1 TaxID=1476194 RepID=UPI000BA57669|nr:hypothetical protein [Helicobacter sp. 11S02596-1]PAF43536.1 hypothetical protein BJI48_04575 [Helicobacter sp. 11S02596-1]